MGGTDAETQRKACCVERRRAAHTPGGVNAGRACGTV